MNQDWTVVMEATAEYSLASCEDFLLDRLELPLAKVEEISRRLVETSLTKLGSSASVFPLCRLALELGIPHYRELLVEDYRVIYRCWPESSEVAIYLFCHQRQDFKQLLFEYQLLS